MTQPTPSGRPRLTRPREHYVFGGVCAGLAEFFGWTPYQMRLLFVLSCVLPGPQFLLYFILWYVIPNAPKPTDQASEPGRPAVGGIARS